MKSLIRALGYLKRYWLVTLGAFFSLLSVTALDLVTPQLLQRTIDRGLVQRDLRLVIIFALALIGVAVVKGFFSFAQGYLSAQVSQDVAYDLRNELYAKIQSLSFSYHDRAQTGQLMTRATSDVDAVRMFTGSAFLQLISSILMLLGSVVLLLRMNWQLALVTISVIPFTLAIVLTFSTRARDMFQAVQQKLAALNTVLQENLAGARVVKAFAREPYEAERYAERNLDLLQQSVKVSKIISFVFPSVFFLTNLGQLGITWVGGLFVIGGKLTIGELVAFSSYLMMVTWPVLRLGMITGMMARAAASAERVFEILDAVSEVTDAPDAITLPPITGHVVFENVSFRYFQGGEDVLKDVSFEALPGQTIALLGATGSGKSTIINLIPRFYDVTEGRVLIDGYDVRKVKKESLRSQIGIVLQETTLFTGTIRENIAFGRPEASMEEIEAAAKAAAAHEFIISFPEGYETRVGERGVTLSGGQKQRIAIARALLTNPRILILDDSTSNVDLETEYRIQQALDNLMKGRTSFVIAQRISTVLNADQILVLDKGRVVARGTHEELLESSPLYAEIYYSQLQPASELVGAVPAPETSQPQRRRDLIPATE